jgi:hypothetical protein
MRTVMIERCARFAGIAQAWCPRPRSGLDTTRPGGIKPSVRAFPEAGRPLRFGVDRGSRRTPMASRRASSSRSGAARRRARSAKTWLERLGLALIVICLAPGAALAQYNTRASVTTSGALTFTGNALGLDGEEDENEPGPAARSGRSSPPIPASRTDRFPTGRPATGARTGPRRPSGCPRVPG